MSYFVGCSVLNLCGVLVVFDLRSLKLMLAVFSSGLAMLEVGAGCSELNVKRFVHIKSPYQSIQ